MRLVFDMETRDPDDILSLCLLCDHPRVHLSAITINPGTTAQVGVVREVLNRTNQISIPIGARMPDAKRDTVSPFHYCWLGEVPTAPPDAVSHELLADQFTRYPETVLLTGAPLHNLRLLLNMHPGVHISRWVAQGGFAGDNVVPAADRLAKFAGMDTCATFNFNGDKKAALLALETPRIKRRELVSKNVTHGLPWDRQFHERVAACLDQGRAGLRLAHHAMTVYLKKHPEGKLLHDPLAACAAIDPTILNWAEVAVIYAHGKWGSKPAHGTNTYISVAVDRDRFFEVLIGRPKA